MKTLGSRGLRRKIRPFLPLNSLLNSVINSSNLGGSLEDDKPSHPFHSPLLSERMPRPKRQSWSAECQGSLGLPVFWKGELMLYLHSQGLDGGLDSGMGEHIVFWREAGLQGSENPYHERWYQPSPVSMVCWPWWNRGAAEQVAKFTFFLEPGGSMRGLCGGMYVSGVCVYI